MGKVILLDVSFHFPDEYPRYTAGGRANLESVNLDRGFL